MTCRSVSSLTTTDSSEVIEPSSLEPQTKRGRTKEDRMKSVMEGREGREEYTSREKRRKEKRTGGKTNLEKKKNQPFMLAKQKRDVREKGKASARDRQNRKLREVKKRKMK